MNSRPAVAAIVVTYNTLDDTRECIRSLLRVRYPRLGIVVVDNNSSDGTAAALAREFPGVTVLAESENLGFTGGTNAGIRWCLARDWDAILLLNSDTRVDEAFLERMVPHLKRDCIIAPVIRPLDGRGRRGPDPAWFDWRRGVACASAPAVGSHGGRPSRIASGCCLLIPREVFTTIGLLDENFFLYYEDVDFVVRAQMAGFELVQEPAAVIYHRQTPTVAGRGVSPLKLYYNTRNRLYLMRKHARMGIWFVTYFAATRAGYALRYLVTGEFKLLVFMIRAIRDYTQGRLARAEYRW